MVRGISGTSSAPECRTARTRCASSSPALPATLKNVASSTPPKKTTSKTLPGPSEDKAPPSSAGSAEINTPQHDCNICIKHTGSLAHKGPFAQKVEVLPNKS